MCLFTLCAAVNLEDSQEEQFLPSPRMVRNYAEIDEDDDEVEYTDDGLER